MRITRITALAAGAILWASLAPLAAQEAAQGEAKGFSFEAAEASVALLMKRAEPEYRAPFELLDFLVNVEHRTGRGVNYFTLVREHGHWRVMSIVWDTERPGNVLPLQAR